MLHDRQQLDVRESQPPDVSGESWSDLAIPEESIAFFGDSRPGAEVYFVDEHRVAMRIPEVAPGYPVVVAPVVDGRRRLHDRRRSGGLLHLEGEGIGFDADVAGSREDLELVQRARGKAWDENLPH